MSRIGTRLQGPRGALRPRSGYMNMSTWPHCSSGRAVPGAAAGADHFVDAPSPSRGQDSQDDHPLNGSLNKDTKPPTHSRLRRRESLAINRTRLPPMSGRSTRRRRPGRSAWAGSTAHPPRTPTRRRRSGTVAGQGASCHSFDRTATCGPVGREPRGTGGGVYVDIAAHHFKRISNTYYFFDVCFFDVCLGWRGVCVEANPVYHAGIRAHRSCDLVPQCASNGTHELNFVLPRNEGTGGLGGVGGGKLAKYAKSCPECKQAPDDGPQKLTAPEFSRLGVSRDTTSSDRRSGIARSCGVPPGFVH